MTLRPTNRRRRATIGAAAMAAALPFALTACAEEEPVEAPDIVQENGGGEEEGEGEGGDEGGGD